MRTANRAGVRGSDSCAVVLLTLRVGETGKTRSLSIKHKLSRKTAIESLFVQTKGRFRRNISHFRLWGLC
ncbi:uncharacterized [Tachysurus ichikawai]